MMLTNNYSAIAHFITKVSELVPREEMPALVSCSDDALDELLLVSASVNKIAFHVDYSEIPDGANMLVAVNSSLADLGHAIGELNKLFDTMRLLCDIKEKQAAPANQPITPKQVNSTPQIGVKDNTGGSK